MVDVMDMPQTLWLMCPPPRWSPPSKIYPAPRRINGTLGGHMEQYPARALMCPDDVRRVCQQAVAADPNGAETMAGRRTRKQTAQAVHLSGGRLHLSHGGRSPDHRGDGARDVAVFKARLSLGTVLSKLDRRALPLLRRHRRPRNPAAKIRSRAQCSRAALPTPTA